MPIMISQKVILARLNPNDGSFLLHYPSIHRTISSFPRCLPEACAPSITFSPRTNIDFQKQLFLMDELIESLDNV